MALNERNGHVERVITVNGKCAAIFEEAGAWCVDDGDGNEVARGLRDEDHAEQVARRHLAK